MSLATRCSACGTVFRVVEDQLKMSEGWVRCGRCKDVFNALESLFDLERDPPPPWPAGASTEGGASVPARAEASERSDLPPSDLDIDITLDLAEPAGTTADEAAGSVMPDGPVPAAGAATDETSGPIEPSADAPARGPVGSGPAELSYGASRPAVEHAALPLQAAAVDEREVPSFVAPAVPASAAAAAAGLTSAEDAAPSFLRSPRRVVSRPSPRVEQRALIAAAVLLGLALVAQVARQHRHEWADALPASRPLLAGLCAVSGCSMDPPRRLDDVAVESSSLVRAAAAAGSDALRLHVVLRNRGPLAIATPSVELSLTDGAGQLVARRAFAAGDFHRGSAQLAPQADTALDLLFSPGSLRIAGYTVEVFYP